MRFDGNYGAAVNYEPNSLAEAHGRVLVKNTLL
jgi:hypothetical protein